MAFSKNALKVDAGEDRGRFDQESLTPIRPVFCC